MNAECGSCPSPETLEGIASGEVPEQQVAAHIARCPLCASFLESASFAKRFAGVINEDQVSHESHAITLPTVFGYEMIGELGHGGQGSVYKAIQSATGQSVAIKVIHSHTSGPAPRARARFLREIQISASLNHPGIVRVLDSLKLGDGRDAIVMEYVEGVPIDAWLGLNPEISHRQILLILAECADALHHAHQRGVIHRDLKPSNILIDRFQQPHILDFGVARRSSPVSQGDRVTLTGEFTGTLAYAAPEQVMEEHSVPDIRTDIYALGLILYRCLLGKLPYKVDGSLDSVVRNITGSVPSRQREDGVEQDYWAVVSKAIAKEPIRRYQSARELAADLRRAAAGEAIVARGDHALYQFRKKARKYRGLIAMLLALFLGLAGIIVAKMYGNAQLRIALHKSTMQQLHAYIDSNARDRAEQIFWTLADREVPLGVSIEEALWSASGTERQLLWAFMEMQDRATCLRSQLLGPGALIALQPTLDNTFGAISGDGRVVWITLEGDEPVLDYGVQLPAGTITGWFSRSGDRVIALMGNGVRCVDTRSGEVLGEYDATDRNAAIGGIAMSDWGVAVSWRDGLLRVFSIPDFELLLDRTDLPAAQTVWLNPDEQRVVYFGNDHRVHEEDIGVGTTNVLTGPVSDPDTPLENAQILMDPQRGRVMMSYSGRLVFGELSEGVPILSRASRDGYRLSMSLNHDGSVLGAQAFGDSTLRLWDTASGDELPGFPGHSGAVFRHAFSTDGKRVLTFDRMGVLRVWAIPGSGWRTDLDEHASTTHQIVIDAGSRVIGSDEQKHTRVYSISHPGVSDELLDAGRAVQAVRFALSESGTLLAAADLSGNVLLLPMQPIDATSTRLQVGRGDQVSGVCFDRATVDSDRFVLSTLLGRVLLVDPSESLEPRVVVDAGLGDAVQCSDIQWAPGTDVLSVSTRDGRVALLDARTLRVLRWIKVSGDQVRAIAYAPDGSRVAAVGDSGRVHLIDPVTGTIERSERISDDSLFSIAFHPKGHTLVVGDRGGRVLVIDANTGTQLAGFESRGSIMSLGFTQDGNTLLVAALGCPIERWDFGSLTQTFDRLRPSR